MEKCSVRDAAIKLTEWFSIPIPEQGEKKTTIAEKQAEPSASTEKTESTVCNQPLKFQLKNIDYAHSYLTGRGISQELAEQFGVGYFSGNGSMNGRIVIPIHNERGELLAYAGRCIDGSEPRYKVPPGFHKSVELFNLHRVIGDSNPERQVVVVEGFFDCMKVQASRAWHSLATTMSVSFELRVTFAASSDDSPGSGPASIRG